MGESKAPPIAVVIEGRPYESIHLARRDILTRCRLARDRILWVKAPTPKEVDAAFQALCAVLAFNRLYPDRAIGEDECRQQPEIPNH